MPNVALNVEIIPNDNDKEHEDPHGRVHVSHRRTWTLVVNGEFYGEYNTKREVVARAARLAAKTAAKHCV